MLEQFLAYLKVERGLSKNTLHAYGSDLRQFQFFVTSLGVVEPCHINREHVGSFCEMGAQHELSASSVHRKLSALRRFFWFLRKEGKITTDPVCDIDLPKVERGCQDLPKSTRSTHLFHDLQAIVFGAYGM